MITLQGVIVIGCFITAASTALRGEMLRKRLDPRPDIERATYSGNWPMIICMDLTALSFVGVALETMAGRVGPALAGCMACCGLTSLVILGSMIGHNAREAARRRARETRVQDVQEMKEAVQEVIPAAVERSLERVTTDFMKPAPDHDRLIRVDPLPASSAPEA